METATFAGGCFWCLQHALDNREGVVETVTGYTGGDTENPTYQEVCTGATGHYEAVQVKYDPQEITYKQLLDIFWQQIDPLDDGGQFVDRGPQYRTAIFYHNDHQQKVAQESKDQIQEQFEKQVATDILPAQTFYRAEEEHQDYAKKRKLRYKLYEKASGRDQRLKELWSQDLKEKLSPLQYKVTQQDATEPAFDNAYWDNKREGIYVDVVSGEPLFSSKDKFESGTGWPSFTQPLESKNITTQKDRSWFTTRTEVRSKKGDSHLGHVFDDGPAPTGKRYCINSAALRFIPKQDLKKEGYEEYKNLFTN